MTGSQSAWLCWVGDGLGLFLYGSSVRPGVVSMNPVSLDKVVTCCNI